MKSKNIWLFLGIFIIAAAGGFFLGRYVIIKRSAIIFSKGLPDKIPPEEIHEYRKKMDNLRKLMESERKKILISTHEGDMEELKRHIDSVSKLKKKIMLETVEQIHKISKTLPPEFRKHFIEHKLKEVEVEPPHHVKFKIIERRNNEKD